MAYPVTVLTKPADLVNAPNGRLQTPPLTKVDFPGRPGGLLHTLAARAFRALAAECLKATGVTLTVTSTADAYRTFDRQWQTWFSRYHEVNPITYAVTPSSRRKRWMNGPSYGKGTYWAKTQQADGSWPADAACPGESNHGWGLALDVCEWTGKGVKGIAGSAAWPWLLANAARYGFSWENQSEPWHIRYVRGDNVPQAVLDYEGPVLNLPPFAPEWGAWGLWPIIPAAQKPVLGVGASGDAVKYAQGVLRLKAGQAAVTIDGQFGPVTAEAVKNVQRFFRPAKVDGVIDAETWGTIDYLAGT